MKHKRKELKCKICGSSLVWSGKKRCQRCINLGLIYPIKIKKDSQKDLQLLIKLKGIIMLKLISILLVLTFLFFNIARAQDQDSILIDGIDSLLAGNVLIGEYKFWAPSESLTIADILAITWKDGIVDIIYIDSSKVTGAAQIFFDWIKQYIEGNYYLLKKKDYQFTDAYQYEMYFKLKGE